MTRIERQMMALDSAARVFQDRGQQQKAVWCIALSGWLLIHGTWTPKQWKLAERMVKATGGMWPII